MEVACRHLPRRSVLSAPARPRSGLRTTALGIQLQLEHALDVRRTRVLGTQSKHLLKHAVCIFKVAKTAQRTRVKEKPLDTCLDLICLAQGFRKATVEAQVLRVTPRKRLKTLVDPPAVALRKQRACHRQFFVEHVGGHILADPLTRERRQRRDERLCIDGVRAKFLGCGPKTMTHA